MWIVPSRTPRCPRVIRTRWWGGCEADTGRAIVPPWSTSRSSASCISAGRSGADGKTGEELVLYDSTDLVTHAVCVGMTGSGKTGLCIDLLEEAAIDGVPAILIDPKGDLGNLLLTFPDLAPADFAPWVDPGAAARAGVDVDTFAAQEAARWKEGLAGWGQDGERIRRLRAAADFAIYTPGSDAGRPLSVLGSLAPPADRDDAEGLRDAIASTATGLLALVGIAADPVQSREHILLATILQDAWTKGQSLDLPTLIAPHPGPGRRRASASSTSSRSSRPRTASASRWPSTTCSPRRASTSGCAATRSTCRRCCTARAGGRASRSSPSRTSATRSGCSSSRCCCRPSSAGCGASRARRACARVLYLDEVYGFAPPVAEPPSKRPLLTLMKQARAAGLGVVLATQNPVDLDYKGLANAGTWLIGRLQTERDRERLLDGLESAQAGGGVRPRGGEQGHRRRSTSASSCCTTCTRTGPSCSSSRWAMSYLAGPLTREQIRRLTPADAAPAPAAPRPRRGTAAPRRPPRRHRRAASGGPPVAAARRAALLPARASPGPGGRRAALHACAAGHGRRALPAGDGRRRPRRGRRLPRAARGRAVAGRLGRRGTGGRGERRRRRHRRPRAPRRTTTPPGAAAEPKRYAAWQREFVTWLTQSQERDGAAVASASSSSAGRARTRPTFRAAASGRPCARSATRPSPSCARSSRPRWPTLEERIRRAESGRAARGATRPAAPAWTPRSRSAPPCSAPSSVARRRRPRASAARGPSCAAPDGSATSRPTSTGPRRPRRRCGRRSATWRPSSRR